MIPPVTSPCVDTHGADIVWALLRGEMVSPPQEEADGLLGTLQTLGTDLLDLHWEISLLTNFVHTPDRCPPVESLKMSCLPFIKRFIDFADAHWKAGAPFVEQIEILDSTEEGQESADLLKNAWMDNGHQFGETTKALNWLLHLVDCLAGGKSLPSPTEFWAFDRTPQVVIDPATNPRPPHRVALVTKDVALVIKDKCDII
jgi:hypothetical protein